MATKKLVLKTTDLRKNTRALFAEIENDEKLRKRFIEDPAGVLSQRVFRSKLPSRQASEANRLLFAMLQNNRFVKWVGDYAEKHRGQRVPDDQYARDFAQALLDHGDPAIVTAVMRNALLGFGLPGGGPVAQQFLINNAAQQAIFAKVNQPASSDQKLRSSQNFNGFSLGANVNPAIMRMLLEQLVARAKTLAKEGALVEETS